MAEQTEDPIIVEIVPIMVGGGISYQYWSPASEAQSNFRLLRNGSLLSSEELTTGPYSEPEDSNPRLHI
jgi:hypothetical protein